MTRSSFPSFLLLTSLTLSGCALDLETGDGAEQSVDRTAAASCVGDCNALVVHKTAKTSRVRKYLWSIEKTASVSDILLAPDQTFVVSYDVLVQLAGYTDSTFAAFGNITIQNPSAQIATITSVEDAMGDISGVVDCGVEFPYDLDPGATLTCTYTADLPDDSPRTNVATVSTEGPVAGGEGQAAVSFTNAYTKAVDFCVDVSDDHVHYLGRVCGHTAPRLYEYDVEIGPFAECGPHEIVNTAEYKTTDTCVTGSSTATVVATVPCEGGCTLTPGYWKTHSARGPAPFDPTWDQLANAENTPFFLSNQSYYEVLWTAPQGNAYYILAHAYIAAQLNQLAGSSISGDAADAFAQGTNLLSVYTPAQVSLLKGSNATRQAFLAAATILDEYNNGLIGPGHCDEDSSSN